MANRAAFIDRDGTMAVDAHCCLEIAEWMISQG